MNTVPGAQTPAIPTSIPQIAAPVPEALSQRLEPIAERVRLDAGNLPSFSSEGARASGEDHIRLLLGEKLPEPSEGVRGVPSPGASSGLAKPSPASARDHETPAPPDPAKNPAVRRMIQGTMAFKLGMEAMTTAVPFVAMHVLGGATAVALLVVATYGLSQALASSFSGALTDRFRASRVLAVSILAQGVLVLGILGLSVGGLLAGPTLFPAYAVIGAAVGIAETARRVIPPLILGQDEETLRRYNGRLHRWYEAAGVAGSALTGLMIWKLGALNALWVTPPAALAAGLVFWGVSHAFAPAPAGRPSPSEGVKSWLEDVRTGARLVFKDSRLRWVAVAMVLPQIVHRLFENLLLPVYAKGLLGHEALSAALLTASNFGELIGASVLLKYSSRFKGPWAWVRWAAWGLLGSWSLSLTRVLGLSPLYSLPVLLPLILVFSMTWASSHLSLETEVQKSVAKKDQPRVVSLLYGMFVVGAAAASIVFGRFLDWLPLASGFAWINAAFTVLAAMVWLAARRLRERPPSP